MRRRVTVIVLCVCLSVCLSVPTKSALYLIFTSRTKFYRLLNGVLMFLLCGFYWKRFVQEFWHHLLVTATFLAPWLPFDGQTRQRWLVFNSNIVCMASSRSSNMTGSSLIVAHWQRSFLAICACYKLLTQHRMLFVRRFLCNLENWRALCRIPRVLLSPEVF